MTASTLQQPPGTDTIDPPASRGVGPDQQYADFIARAVALPPGAVGAADALMTEIVASDLPDTTFKPLATAIAKATGFDADALKRKMQRARKRDQDAEPGEPVAPPCAEDVEPQQNPAPLDRILDQIVKIIRTRVHCRVEEAVAVALWSAGTYGVFPPSDPGGGPDLFPFLAFSSPTKRCGKTTMLETIQTCVRRPCPFVDTTSSALFRTIEAYRPTMILDELDRLMHRMQEIAGIMNSAHHRGGHVLRSEEIQAGNVRTFIPRAFPTYTPIVFAGIGATLPTFQDRSVRIRLQRQPRGARRQRLGFRRMQRIRATIAPQLMAHADAIGGAMAAGVAQASISAALNDRDYDNWEPLCAVADLAGGSWPDRARRAAVELCKTSSSEDDRDIEWRFRQIVEGCVAKRRETVDEYLAWRAGGRKVIKPRPGTKGINCPPVLRFIKSDDLAFWLLTKDDSGFGDARDPQVVKLRVARVLKKFEIKPSQKRIAPNTDPERGYFLNEIRGAWRNYQP
jgi:hypothetical protein